MYQCNQVDGCKNSWERAEDAQKKFLEGIITLNEKGKGRIPLNQMEPWQPVVYQYEKTRREDHRCLCHLVAHVNFVLREMFFLSPDNGTQWCAENSATKQVLYSKKVSRVETFAISRIFRAFAKVYTREIVLSFEFAKYCMKNH